MELRLNDAILPDSQIGLLVTLVLGNRRSQIAPDFA